MGRSDDRGRSRGASWLIAIGPLVLVCLVARGGASAPPAPEPDVKAAFLYSFAKFVEWPSQAFASAEDPIVIGVGGEDPFGDTLDRTVAGRTAQGRRLVVRRFSRAAQLVYCHILYLGAAEDAESWLAALRAGPGFGTLTVGEGAAFGRHGAIAFVHEGHRIRIAVNLDAAAGARLRISSRLLALAHVQLESGGAR